MHKVIGIVALLVASVLASVAPGRAAADTCAAGQYETASGCVCPAGQHVAESGGCATDDLAACPAGQYATSDGCVCPAGSHESADTGECATDIEPALGTAAVAGAHKTIHHKKKRKRHRH